MASRRAYSNPAMRQAPQAAWAATRRAPSEKGGAGMPLVPQKPQPSKRQLQMQQQQQQQQPLLPPGVYMFGQGAGAGAAAGAGAKAPMTGVGVGAVPGRKPPVILPRVKKVPWWAAQASGVAAAATATGGMAQAGAAVAAATATMADPNARPSFRALSLLALQRGAPFIGFGIVDNAIMIVAGDYIEMSIGVTLGIGTMTAAALGNILADVVGLNLGGLIEDFSHRRGIPEPVLSAPQQAMGVTKAVSYASGSLGIALGCLLGMIPLLFITHTAKEEHPGEIFATLGQRAAQLLGCQRAMVYELDPATGHVLREYASIGEGGIVKEALPRPLADEMLQQVRTTREALRYRRERPWWWHQQQGGAEGGVVDGGAAEALATITTTTTITPTPGRDQGGLDSALCLPVLGGADGRTVVGVVAAVNARAPAQPGHGQRDGSGSGFAAADARALAGLCAQASEALANLTRRPEECVSLGENLEMLARHSALPLREYRPTLAALLGAERAAAAAAAAKDGKTQAKADARAGIRAPIAAAVTAAAAVVGPVSARAPAAPAVGGEGGR